MVTNKTFKEFQWRCFSEENFCDPNFSDSERDSDFEGYACEI